MNRLFGTKKKEEPKIAAPVQEEKKYDLIEQSKKVENRVTELDSKLANLDNEIRDLFVKVRNSRGSQQQSHKQKLMMLMKRRKMLENQTKNYMNQQMALDNVAFTQENIQNTMEMAAAMKQGLAANMEAMKGVNIDQLQDLKDDMQDMMWECNQINDALNYDLDGEVDEDEIDAELAEFENEMKIQGPTTHTLDRSPAKEVLGGALWNMPAAQ